MSFKVGDKVQWTYTSTKKNGFNMSTRKGKITAIEGGKIQVIYRKKFFTGNPDVFTLVSEQSPLTKACLAAAKEYEEERLAKLADNNANPQQLSPTAADLGK